ncbi:MAG: hypothetical protein M3R36_08420 [Bacteroidota bacterium]|nr:hypothetical protein [Bacteroidota bacterium]
MSRDCKARVDIFYINNMAQSSIDKLIINSPYSEPSHYWKYDREARTFSLEDGRRLARYVIASESSRSFDDPGRFIEIPLTNLIRPNACIEITNSMSGQFNCIWEQYHLEYTLLLF